MERSECSRDDQCDGGKECHLSPCAMRRLDPTVGKCPETCPGHALQTGRASPFDPRPRGAAGPLWGRSLGRGVATSLLPACLWAQ